MNKEIQGFQAITKKVAENIHEYLYSAIKLGDNEKATLISGILIALNDDSFRNSYLAMTDEDQFVEAFMNAIKFSIKKYDGLKNGKDEVISVFDFIRHNSSFKKTMTNNGKTFIALQFLTSIIHQSVYVIAKEHPTYDIMAEFYNEFTKYSGADQQSLGIVLTPHHIANFMSELLEINDNDVILDTAAGSASLLLTAEHRTVKENKVVAVELNARMLSLAVANTMIRNIPAALYLGDSWAEDIQNEIRVHKPTKLIINPPYAQKGYPELGFVLRGLNLLEKGGLGVVILPISSGTKTNNETKTLKKELQEKHTLLAVFTMSKDLFEGVGVHPVIMLFKAHEQLEVPVFLADVSNDGHETVKNKGRQDTKELWLGIKNNIIEKMKNLEESDLSLVKKLNFEEEWSIAAHKTFELKVSEKDFIKKLRQFDKFINPEKYEMEED